MRYPVPIIIMALSAAIAGAQTPSTTTGKVLLLPNGQYLEGDIELIGERFRIRRGASETWIPAKPEHQLLPDRTAVYEKLKAGAKLQEPTERVRLARWCWINGLKNEAIQESAAAVALRPKNKQLQQFHDELKQLASREESKPIDAPPSNNSEYESAVANVRPEVLGMFVSKVQPILMNACANCHAGSRGVRFGLVRHSSGQPSSRATQANLAAVAEFLDHEKPIDSPLLLNAISSHGDAKSPPIADRQGQAYRYLEEWVNLAVGRANAPLPSKPQGDAVGKSQSAGAPQRPMDMSEPKPLTLPEAPAPARPSPVDPFDPAHFNQKKPSRK